ncbi:MAG TPA: phosphoribosylaminoimidazolesuccinocarboxamide synthase [Rhodothermales bacterium]|nr:phosphoribosylaminoimidazolesuccinocarboxamide synthase [Rhodothermales bacterium]
MKEATIEQQLDHCLSQTHLEAFGAKYSGKVRDTYRHDGQLVLVTTDRISAFDHILRQPIPFKGQVLNRLAAFFFESTADLVPNHIISVPDPNVTIAVHCAPIPVEFVVRGYLAGHAWREYRAGKRELCGQVLPEGLRQNSRLPHPILTPATKAAEGHDEDTSRAEIIERGILSARDFDELEEAALRLFERGTELAGKRGLILVDTKYEFGRDANGRFLLIDEVHTPDSSRYFYADSYEDLLAADQPQRQLSKEFVREWLMEHGFQGQAGQALPDLSNTFRIQVAGRYIELFETITGSEFSPETSPDPEARIRRALEKALPSPERETD